MIFLLFLLVSVGIGNIIVTMFFPYPTALMSMGLQFAFFAVSFLLFLNGLRKRRKIIRAFLVTAMHGSIFVLLLYIFFNITLPNKEKGDTDAFRSVFKGIMKMLASSDSKSEKARSDETKIDSQEESEKSETTKAAKTHQTQPERNSPAPLVDDPF